MLKFVVLLLTGAVAWGVADQVHAQTTGSASQESNIKAGNLFRTAVVSSISEDASIIRGDGHVMTVIENRVNSMLISGDGDRPADDVMQLRSRKEISHDENGIGEVVYYEPEGTDLQKDRRVVFDRKESGYVRTEEYFDRFDDVFVPVERMTWNYYQDSHMPESILVERWNDERWQYHERESVTFADGDPEVVLTEKWYDGEWVRYQQMTFESVGEDVVQTFETWDGEWLPAERVTVTGARIADMVGFMIFMEEYDLLELEESLFHFLGAVPFGSMLQEEWDSDEQQWVPMELFEIRTDVGDDGDYAVYIEHHDEGELELQFRLLFVYNPAGEIDVIRMEIPVDEDEDGYVWHTQMTEDYVYGDLAVPDYVLRRSDFDGEVIDVERLDFTWAEDPYVTDAQDDPDQPVATRLLDAYPNPFNPETVVPFELASDEHVTIHLYDVTGRMVATLYEGRQSAGRHHVRVSAGQLAGGVYLVRMQTAGYSGVTKITLVK